MSGHRYTNSTNPFDEDDIDDEEFLKNSRVRPPTNSYSNHSSFDDHLQSLQERRKQIEDRTIHSTERSIGILRDSEQIGIATAEELSRQREQLERTDKRLDEINQTLRFSQKHINGIKSVFSSLKNYMSGRSEQSPTISSSSSAPTTIAANDRNGYNPTPSQPDYDRYEMHPSTRLKAQGYQTQTQNSGSRDISARLEANLQEMSSSISRLKGLATDLSFEIDSQNELIDTISDKTETADIMLKRQNKDMQKILGKK